MPSQTLTVHNLAFTNYHVHRLLHTFIDMYRHSMDTHTCIQTCSLIMSWYTLLDTDLISHNIWMPHIWKGIWEEATLSYLSGVLVSPGAFLWSPEPSFTGNPAPSDSHTHSLPHRQLHTFILIQMLEHIDMCKLAGLYTFTSSVSSSSLPHSLCPFSYLPLYILHHL